MDLKILDSLLPRRKTLDALVLQLLDGGEKIAENGFQAGDENSVGKSEIWSGNNYRTESARESDRSLPGDQNGAQTIIGSRK